MTEQLTRGAARPTGVGQLFQLLRDGQPRTRADLAAVTGQARSTVAARVDQLLASGLVTPAGEASSTGGRPPVTFAFNPSARVVLAVDLGATHARLAVTDLAGQVLAEHHQALAIAEGPDVVLDRVARVGSDLVAEAGRTMTDLVSVGVGLPGPVDHATGRPTNPPIMPGWDDADVPGHLGRLLGVPVLVDNDVNVMALGEHATSYPEVAHLLFVKVATGIGAGIISDGQIRRGAQGAAGDLASGQAVATALAAGGHDVRSSTDVVALVRSGDVAASRAVRQAGRDIGGVLAACVSLLNPSLIVVGGIVAESGEHLLAGIREVVYRRSLPLATQHLRIVTTRTKGRAGVLGASAMAAEHVLSPAAIDASLG
jgi:predicted NBD/HSP70 family sugar kinase